MMMMKKSVVSLNLVVSLFCGGGMVGCVGTEPPTGECVYLNWQSAVSEMPVCPSLVETYGCETFNDYNQDGIQDVVDMRDFCSEVSPGVGRQPIYWPRAFHDMDCVACDGFLP